MNNKKEKLTIYDISDKAGVSIATVSRVLNGYSNVNPDTKEKVLKVMEEMGYKPNAFARGLGLDTMKTIGILCADSSDTYLAKAVYYIEEELRIHQYDSLLVCTGYNASDKQKALDLLISKKVDAAILVGSNFLDSTNQGNKYIRDAADTIPVMLLNAMYEYPNVYSLYCDDFNATKMAVDFLFESGKRKILYLYSSKSYSATKKLEGFKASYEARGLPLSKEYLQFMPYSCENILEIEKAVNALYESGLEFDAIVASEDYLAIAALKCALKRSIKVPEELSLVGYNNSFFSCMTEPELSSIDNKLEALSKQLVSTLLGVLDGKEMPKKTEYSGELIKRGTT